MFNEGMQYNNGVFLILEPGYYQVVVNLLPSNSDTDIQADIMVNNKHGNGFARSIGGSLNMVSIAKLELFDSVNVRIRAGKTTTSWDANNFQIQKIYFNNH